MSGYQYNPPTVPTAPIVAPSNPQGYLDFLLREQGLDISVNYLLLGDSTTDVVNGVTHTASNGALVGEPVNQDSRLHLSSPLVGGRFVFPSTSARIQADDDTSISPTGPDCSRSWSGSPMSSWPRNIASGSARPAVIRWAGKVA
jgi:hypothetical protein